MNRDTAKQLMDELNKVLPVIGNKLNLSLSLGRCSFNSNTARVKVEAASIASDGEVLSKEVVDFKRYADGYGLKPADLGKTFTMGGKTYTISGLAMRSRRFPILATHNDKTYKFPASTVLQMLSLENNNLIPPLSQITKPLSKELHEKFLNLCSSLSPENLTCDGELSQSQVNQRHRELMSEWRKLEAIVGRIVTEDEIWSMSFSR